MKVYKEVNTVDDLLKMTGSAYKLGTCITQSQLDKLFSLSKVTSISEKDFQDLCKYMFEIIAPKKEEPVCPYCKTDLEVTDTYDEELDGDTVIEKLSQSVLTVINNLRTMNIILIQDLIHCKKIIKGV